MKYLSVVLPLFLVACSQQPASRNLGQMLESGKWIDLSYAFSSETIYWPNNPEGFRLDTQFNGTTPAGFYYSSYAFYAPEHGGTHLDAPVHFAAGHWSTDQIPLTNLMGNAVVVDVQEKVNKDKDYQISIGDVEAWEQEHGPVPDSAILLFRTGWGQYYPDAARYLGTAEKGQEAVALLHFPGIQPELAAWLIKNRKVRAVGLDTPSIDFGQSKDFKTHQLLYAQNILGFENLAHLEQVPATGAFLVALPMKIKGGSGGPLRVVAWIPHD